MTQTEPRGTHHRGLRAQPSPVSPAHTKPNHADDDAGLWVMQNASSPLEDGWLADVVNRPVSLGQPNPSLGHSDFESRAG